MASRFTGKVAVITGGSSGIGLAAAQAFAAEGARVMLIGRTARTLEAAAASIGAAASIVAADVANPADIERALRTAGERYGRIDVLFANAGLAALMPIGEVTEALWDSVADTNLKGVFFTVRHALPLMPRGGVIVLDASLAAYRSLPGMSVYAATKAGVVALARSLAVELIGHGVRINAICPGPIETGLTERTAGLNEPGQAGSPGTPAPQESRDRINRTPMGRAGTPQEAAAAVLFLASDEAAFITGTALTIDGGIAAA